MNWSSLSKKQLRRQLLNHRQSLDEKTWLEKSVNICENLESFPLFQQAQTILAYFPIRQEPNLTSLFIKGRSWGFSRCVDQSLVWHRWNPGEGLNLGNYGILEPYGDTPLLNPCEVDLILVPCVACDNQGYRLGYGGGFYDRLLSEPQWQKIPTVGIIFDFAFLTELPIDPWDQKLTAICTENLVHICIS